MLRHNTKRFCTRRKLLPKLKEKKLTTVNCSDKISVQHKTVQTLHKQLISYGAVFHPSKRVKQYITQILTNSRAIERKGNSTKLVKEGVSPPKASKTIF